MNRLSNALRVAVLATSLSLLLSACGDNEETGIVSSSDTAGQRVNTENSEEVTTVVDPDTGEVTTENDGPLDPTTLDIALADPLYLLPGCKDESTAQIVDRIPWDYDADGAKDAVVVTKCTDTDVHNVVVMRATSRGYWPKRIIGDNIEPTIITGGCKLDEAVAQIRCNATSFHPVTQEPTESVFVIQRLQGQWLEDLAQQTTPVVNPSGQPGPLVTPTAQATPTPRTTNS